MVFARPPTVNPLPKSEPYIRPTSPLPTTTTATFVQLDTALPRPELLWPAEHTLLASGDPITFTWRMNQELEGEAWRLIFVLKPGQDAQLTLRQELPLDRREFKVSQTLEPGEYMWTLSVLGAEARGPLAGRRLIVVKPTPIPSS